MGTRRGKIQSALAPVGQGQIGILLVPILFSACAPNLLNEEESTSGSSGVIAASEANSTVSLASTDPVTADGTSAASVQVSLADEDGVAISGVTPEISATGTGNILAGCSETDQDGNSTCSLKSTKAELKTVTLSAPFEKSAGDVTFVHGSAAQLVFTTDPNSCVSVTACVTQPVVEIRDAHDNLVDTGSDSTLQVTLAKIQGTGTLSGTANMNAVAGVADFVGKGLRFDLSGTDKRLIAASGGVASGITSDFTVLHGPATQIAITSAPTSVPADQYIGIVVEVQDAQGNVVNTGAASTTQIDLTLTQGTGPLHGTTSINATGGVADFNGQLVQLRDPGVNKQITVSGGGFANQLTSVFTVTHGGWWGAVFTTYPSTSIVAGQPFGTMPVIEVQDKWGNTVTTGPDATRTVEVQLSSGTGNVLGTTVIVTSAGVANFAGSGLSLDTVGDDKILRAYIPGGILDYSGIITVSHAPASRLAFSTQPSAQTIFGQVFATQPVVQIQDAYGNVVDTGADATRTVSLSLTTGTGTLSGTTTEAAVDGVADFAGNGLSINMMGNDKVLTASYGGWTPGTTSAFEITDFPPNIGASYSTHPAVYDRNIAIAANNPPANSGGAVVTWSVSPALPAGLSIDPGTGIISGTPTVAVDQTTYTITATNTGGQDTVDLDITVRQSVVPVYGNADDWNEWVKNDGSTNYNATNTACSGGTENGYGACLHGGELLKYELHRGETSCSGLSISDSLGVFDWICEDNSGTGPVTFYTTGLKSSKGLKDLIDTTPAWRNNSVTVTGAPSYSSTGKVWWGNTVSNVPGSGDLNGTGTLYVRHTSDLLTSGLILNADGVGLVTLGSVKIRYNKGDNNENMDRSACDSNGTNDRKALVLTVANYNWIEGNYDGSNSNGGFEDTDYDIFLCGETATQSFAQVRRVSHLGTSNSKVYAHHMKNIKLDQVVSQAAGSNDGVTAFNTSYSLFSNLTIDRATAGVGASLYLNAAVNNTVSGLVSDSSGIGLFIESPLGGFPSSTGNNIEGLTLSNVAGTSAIRLQADSDSNSIRNVLISNASNEGITLSNSVASRSNDNNIFHDIRIFNVSNGGVVVNYSSGNIFSKILMGSLGYGFQFSESTGNTILGATLGNIQNTAVSINDNSSGTRGFDNTIVNLVAVNNDVGLMLTEVEDGKFANIVATSSKRPVNETAIDLSTGALHNDFLENLLLGDSTNDCVTTPGGASDYGLVDGTCVDNWGAAALVRFPFDSTDAGASFVGKASGDTTNTSDTSGTAAYAAGNDWTGFDNNFRGWGTEHGNSFPDSNHLGRCSGGTCRIWDWRLKSTDTTLLNRSGDGLNANGAFVNGNPCPSEIDGDRTIVDMHPSATKTFLINAMEISGDNIGNDNGLCESSEACTYMPNFGVYQGEGAYASNSCTFSDGAGVNAVTGVTMYAYPTNGI